EEIRGRTLFRGVGCEKCNGSGYNGRLAIHELLVVDDDIANAIVRDAPSSEINQLARQNGMHGLRDDGIQKAFQGLTTLEEVLAKTAE
ncbi:MAG TPA: type II/IV secretion system protein, partial [Deinococcales bacterium]|nr:type II/IV secretion system protein [Deinococcales bacterium]